MRKTGNKSSQSSGERNIYFLSGPVPLKASKLEPHPQSSECRRWSIVLNFLCESHTGRDERWSELERQRLVSRFPKLNMQFRRSEFVLCASNYKYIHFPKVDYKYVIQHKENWEIKRLSAATRSHFQKEYLYSFSKSLWSHFWWISPSPPPTTPLHMYASP